MTLTVLTLLQYLSASAVMIGLVLYGGDFHTPVGYLYLIPTLLLPVLTPRLGAPAQRWLRRHVRALLAAGVTIGALAYRPLHLGPWDQRSVLQAAAMATFATVSLLACWLAAGDLMVGDPPRPWHDAAALAALALCYGVASWYPEAPVLFAVLCLAAGLAHPWRPDPPEAVPGRLGRPDALDIACFVQAAALADFVWDMDTDPSQGPQLALALLAASLAALARTWQRRRPLTSPGALGPVGTVPLAIVAAVSAVTAVFPGFLLNPLRQALLGVALGVIVGAAIDRAREGGGAGSLMRAWLAITLGIAVSSQFSLQLEGVPAARVLYLAPAVALAAIAFRQARRTRRGPGVAA